MKGRFWQHVIKPKPQAVFFDLDGTLVRVRSQIFLDSFNFAMTMLGLPQSALLSDLRQSRSIKDSIEERIKCPNTQKAAHVLFRYKVASYEISEEEVMSGARNLITAIKAHNIPMGVVSNLDEILVHKQVTALNFPFKVVIGTNYSRSIKPHPAPLQEACAILGLKPSKRIYFVGDTKTDVLCARDAGCSSVLVNSSPSNEVQADFEFQDLKQLIDFFNLERTEGRAL